MLAAAEDRMQPLEQRLDVRAEQSWIELDEQLAHGEQRMRLVGREPEPGQLVARPGAARAEAVTARRTVVLDRRIEAIAHVVEIALERRARNLEGALQIGERHRRTLLEQPVDPIETLEPLHAVPCA